MKQTLWGGGVCSKSYFFNMVVQAVRKRYGARWSIRAKGEIDFNVPSCSGVVQSAPRELTVESIRKMVRFKC
jgi:hypothetical protein